jgi:drug/metabolite transporter (DMT)-like permease
MELNIVSVISVGVAMTSIGEMEFSWVGFAFQAAALLAESGRLVLTNLLMKELKLDPLSALYYIAPVCCSMIGLAFLVFEFQVFPFERLLSPMFLLMLLCNGLVAFTLNIAVVMLIGNTSALILTLAGIVKDLMLVFLSVVVFETPVTQLQYLGYTVALLGLNLHKEFKKSVIVPTEKVVAEVDEKQNATAKENLSAKAVNVTPTSSNTAEKDEKV